MKTASCPNRAVRQWLGNLAPFESSSADFCTELGDIEIALCINHTKSTIYHVVKAIFALAEAHVVNSVHGFFAMGIRCGRPLRMARVRSASSSTMRSLSAMDLRASRRR